LNRFVLKPRPGFEPGLSSLPRTRFTAKLPRQGVSACNRDSSLVVSIQRRHPVPLCESCESFTRVIGEDGLRLRERAVQGGREVVREGPERAVRGATGRGDARQHRQFEYVGFEVAVEAVRVARVLAVGLVAAEGADHLHGGRGGFGTREQVEPARDEHVGREDVHVSAVAVPRDPRVVVDEVACEAQAVVDELDTRRSLGDVHLLVGERARTENGENAGDHGTVGDEIGDDRPEVGGHDVADRVLGGAADRCGFLHHPPVGRGRAKTFGNRPRPPAMIHVADEGRVRVVTMDRPDRRNALTPAGLASLETAVTDAQTPVVYLTGASGAFSAGADLDEVARVAGENDRQATATFIRRGQRVAAAIETADAVVVAGIDGPVRGGGLELALACDLRVCTPAATFGEPGVTFGLFGAWGGTVRLPEVVGTGDALDLSLSGRVVNADEAHRMGLVSRVVEDPRMVAEEVAANDPSALRVLKERVRDRAPVPAQLDAEADAFADLVEEHAEELTKG
jgi:enoyl-CoA hydratase